MHSPLLTKPVFTQPKVEPKRQASRQTRFTFWAGLALMVIILAVAVLHARGVFVQAPSRTIAPPPPQVAVSAPLQRDVDPTAVSPGAILLRDSRGYCLDCLMNSTRLKRRADQSSSIATWRTLSNPA